MSDITGLLDPTPTTSIVGGLGDASPTATSTSTAVVVTVSSAADPRYLDVTTGITLTAAQMYNIVWAVFIAIAGWEMLRELGHLVAMRSAVARQRTVRSGANIALAKVALFAGACLGLVPGSFYPFQMWTNSSCRLFSMLIYVGQMIVAAGEAAAIVIAVWRRKESPTTATAGGGISLVMPIVIAIGLNVGPWLALTTNLHNFETPSMRTLSDSCTLQPLPSWRIVAWCGQCLLPLVGCVMLLTGSRRGESEAVGANDGTTARVLHLVPLAGIHIGSLCKDQFLGGNKRAIDSVAALGPTLALGFVFGTALLNLEVTLASRHAEADVVAEAAAAAAAASSSSVEKDEARASKQAFSSSTDELGGPGKLSMDEFDGSDGKESDAKAAADRQRRTLRLCEELYGYQDGAWDRRHEGQVTVEMSAPKASPGPQGQQYPEAHAQHTAVSVRADGDDFYEPGPAGGSAGYNPAGPYGYGGAVDQTEHAPSNESLAVGAVLPYSGSKAQTSKPSPRVLMSLPPPPVPERGGPSSYAQPALPYPPGGGPHGSTHGHGERDIGSAVSNVHWQGPSADRVDGATGTAGWPSREEGEEWRGDGERQGLRAWEEEERQAAHQRRAQRKAQEEAAAAVAEQDRLRREEAEARRHEEEQAARRRREAQRREEEARRREEEEARLRVQEDARRREEEDARRREEEDARRREEELREREKADALKRYAEQEAAAAAAADRMKQAEEEEHTRRLAKRQAQEAEAAALAAAAREEARNRERIAAREQEEARLRPRPAAGERTRDDTEHDVAYAFDDAERGGDVITFGAGAADEADVSPRSHPRTLAKPAVSKGQRSVQAVQYAHIGSKARRDDKEQERWLQAEADAGHDDDAAPRRQRATEREETSSDASSTRRRARDADDLDDGGEDSRRGRDERDARHERRKAESSKSRQGRRRAERDADDEEPRSKSRARDAPRRGAKEAKERAGEKREKKSRRRDRDPDGEEEAEGNSSRRRERERERTRDKPGRARDGRRPSDADDESPPRRRRPSDADDERPRHRRPSDADDERPRHRRPSDAEDPEVRPRRRRPSHDDDERDDDRHLPRASERQRRPGHEARNADPSSSHNAKRGGASRHDEDLSRTSGSDDESEDHVARDAGDLFAPPKTAPVVASVARELAIAADEQVRGSMVDPMVDWTLIMPGMPRPTAPTSALAEMAAKVSTSAGPPANDNGRLRPVPASSAAPGTARPPQAPRPYPATSGPAYPPAAGRNPVVTAMTPGQTYVGVGTLRANAPPPIPPPGAYHSQVGTPQPHNRLMVQRSDGFGGIEYRRPSDASSAGRGYGHPV